MGKKDIYRKPNAIAWLIIWVIAFLIAKLLVKARIIRNDVGKTKGPYVLLVNHTSSLDQCCLSLVTKRSLTFVIAEALFNTMHAVWFIKLLRTVNKQQFRTDFNDIRKMKAVIDNGGRLVIFPAGVFTSNGKETCLPKATGKFLKLLSVDTYVVKYSGLYLTKPKWSKIIRRGGMEIEAKKIMSADEIKNMSADEAYKIANEALSFDDYEWQEKAMIRYKNGSNLIGLENTLHSCPICKGFKTIGTKNDSIIYCKNCGFEEKADDYCFLHKTSEGDKEIRHISDWAEIIGNELENQINANPEFEYSFSGHVHILDVKARKFVPKCDVNVTINREKIKMADTSGNTLFSALPSTFPAIPCQPGEFFDLQDGIEVYRVYTKDPMDVGVFVDMVNAIYKSQL